MRTGLFGGTFNPIHNGHVSLAQGAKEQLKLDRVIFIPAFIPPHKSSNELADAGDRFRMIELAIAGRPGFEISRFEIEKEAKSYSIETLKYFKASYPEDAEFFFLIGADALKGLSDWKDIDKAFELCKFAVCNRPGFQEDSRYPDIEKIDIADVDISSTQIRKRIKKGESIKGLLPQTVESYIKEKNLYKM